MFEIRKACIDLSPNLHDDVLPRFFQILTPNMFLSVLNDWYDIIDDF
jgi:hypothetical protein